MSGNFTQFRLVILKPPQDADYINRYPASDKACELAWSRLEEGYAEYHREQGEAKKALRWD
jgi:hypothetical protein